MYKPILAALLLAFTLAGLYPEPAKATTPTSTFRTESSYHHRRHRREEGKVIIRL